MPEGCSSPKSVFNAANGQSQHQTNLNFARAKTLSSALLVRFLDQSLCRLLLCYDLRYDVTDSARAPRINMTSHFQIKSEFCLFVSPPDSGCCVICKYDSSFATASRISHDAISGLSHNRRILSRCSQTNSEASITYCASAIQTL